MAGSQPVEQASVAVEACAFPHDLLLAASLAFLGQWRVALLLGPEIRHRGTGSSGGGRCAGLRILRFCRSQTWSVELHKTSDVARRGVCGGRSKTDSSPPPALVALMTTAVRVGGLLAFPATTSLWHADTDDRRADESSVSSKLPSTLLVGATTTLVGSQAVTMYRTLSIVLKGSTAAKSTTGVSGTIIVWGGAGRGGGGGTQLLLTLVI